MRNGVHHYAEDPGSTIAGGDGTADGDVLGLHDPGGADAAG